jgi:hypothetical protein
MQPDLSRLIVRHRHVAPMLSALLGGTRAAVRIVDASGKMILERDASRIQDDPGRFPILVDGATLGWVEGDTTARAVAAVLSYACAREADKRSLAQEALDRYRELNLVYDLAERLGGDLDTEDVVAVAEEEAGKLVRGGRGMLRRGATGVLGAVESSGVAEIVTDLGGDPRADGEERSFASIAAAPVTARGTTLGVLAVGSDAQRELTSADLKLLTAVAAIVGPVLDRAKSAEESTPTPVAER